MPPSTSFLRSLFCAASALSLAGCAAVGPTFRTPAPPAGAAGAGYAMTGDAAASGVRLSPDARAATPWWQAFGSPELDAMIRQALADSPTLAEARATLERAQAEALAVRGAERPQVDASGSLQRERINTQSFGFSFPSPTINLFSVGGAVSYDLDVFGGHRRATEEAGARAQRVARQTDAAYLTLSGNIAMQAMEIAALRAQIAAVNEVVARDRQVVDMVRKGRAVGAESAAAVSAGVAQLLQDEALLPPLQRDLDEARHKLALFAGKSPAEWAAPDFDLASFTVPAEVPVSLPSSLVRQRPDILAAEAEMHVATAAIGVAVANQYPDIRLSASLVQGAIKPDQLFNYASSGWSLMAGATGPVFHGGTLKAQRQAAEAEARASLARYQQTVLRAFVQVSDVLSDLGNDQQMIITQQRAASAADVHARDAHNAYRLGGGPMIDVVDAERTVSRTRRALAQAQGQRMSDLVQLYAATAADWRTADQRAAR